MFNNLTFYSPEFLWLLTLLPLFLLWNYIYKDKKTSSLKISSTKGFVHKTLKIKFLPMLDILRYLAIIFLPSEMSKSFI